MVERRLGEHGGGGREGGASGLEAGGRAADRLARQARRHRVQRRLLSAAAARCELVQLKLVKKVIELRLVERVLRRLALGHGQRERGRGDGHRDRHRVARRRQQRRHVVRHRLEGRGGHRRHYGRRVQRGQVGRGGALVGHLRRALGGDGRLRRDARHLARRRRRPHPVGRQLRERLRLLLQLLARRRLAECQRGADVAALGLAAAAAAIARLRAAPLTQHLRALHPVPPVAHAVVRPARQVLRNLRPPLAVLLHELKDQQVLLDGPHGHVLLGLARRVDVIVARVAARSVGVARHRVRRRLRRRVAHCAEELGLEGHGNVSGLVGERRGVLLVSRRHRLHRREVALRRARQGLLGAPPEGALGTQGLHHIRRVGADAAVGATARRRRQKLHVVPRGHRDARKVHGAGGAGRV
mmetsp:Transcript_7621/g.20015  ORF Transcript_7621/g.20015 Transcript_7621/m.20015 type:complete len:413 (-) Transcript_7621:58-1296(-)